MRKQLGSALAVAIMLLSSPGYAAERYEFDKAHTHIMFYVNHLGFSDMIGLFTKYDGSFTFDPEHPGTSSVDVTLKPEGIRTTSELLDTVLQGSEFFNSDTYPEIHFASKSVKVTGDHKGDLTGDLTMLGVTKPVTLHVRFNKAGYHPLTNLYVAGFSADATLKRSDFGMSHLIPMVSDSVRIEIEVEAINLDRKNSEKLKH